jgi:hypothetical protein
LERSTVVVAIAKEEGNMPETSEAASALQLWGAGCFGAVIGWFLYFINRYRTGEANFGDLTTIIAVVGGGGVLALFPQRTDLFGAYGVGLAAGFFGYFVILAGLVSLSRNFDVDFFLDGRRRAPGDGYLIPPGARVTTAAMSGSVERDDAGDRG